MELKAKITKAINETSREGESSTPDYILGQYLMSCLEAYEKAVTMRDVKSSVDGSMRDPASTADSANLGSPKPAAN